MWGSGWELWEWPGRVRAEFHVGVLGGTTENASSIQGPVVVKRLLDPGADPFEEIELVGGCERPPILADVGGVAGWCGLARCELGSVGTSNSVVRGMNG